MLVVLPRRMAAAGDRLVRLISGAARGASERWAPRAGG